MPDWLIITIHSILWTIVLLEVVGFTYLHFRPVRWAVQITAADGRQWIDSKHKTKIGARMRIRKVRSWGYNDAGYLILGPYKGKVPS